MRLSALLFVLFAAVSGVSEASCSTSNAAVDGGGADATADAHDDDAEPIICQQFTEAGAACPTISPVRCFACGDAGGGCYCQTTADGPRWKCIADPSCLPCTLGDEDCAPDTDAAGDDGGGAIADGGGPADADADAADPADARSD